MEMVGGLLQRLRPGALDELGLAEALQELVAMWQARNESCRCELKIEGELPNNMNEALRVTVYRLVQECLTNVTRHAEATQVTVNLKIKNQLDISVNDNGKGFDANNLTGFGLLGMRERVEGLGGTLVFDTNQTAGTRVLARLPLIS